MLEIVIPLFKVNWITKAVLESLNLHYNPRKIHIISVKKEIETIEKLDLDLPVKCHNEDNFFLEKYNVTKENLLQNLIIKNHLYIIYKQTHSLANPFGQLFDRFF